MFLLFAIAADTPSQDEQYMAAATGRQIRSVNEIATQQSIKRVRANLWRTGNYKTKAKEAQSELNEKSYKELLKRIQNL